MDLETKLNSNDESLKELTIEITNNCPLNCLQCSAHASENGAKYLDINYIEEVLDQFKDFKVVRFSGGEPFQHPDLQKIIKYTKEQGKIVQILSSGNSNREEIISKQFENVGISETYLSKIKKYTDEIILSLHGYYDTHDKISYNSDIYNAKCAWDTLLDTADNLDIVGIPFSFQTVIMKDNYNDESLKDICNIASYFSKNKKMHLHLLRFISQGRGKINNSHIVSEKELINFENTINKLQEKYSNSLIITHTNSFNSDCNCNSRKAVVTWQKEIIPCSALKYMDEYSQKYGINFKCKNRL